MPDVKRTQNQVFNNDNPPPGQSQPVPPPVDVPNINQAYQKIDDLGYEIPVDIVPLPSRGVTYHPDSILHKLEGVEIRAMTAKDEDILTSRALIKKGTVITHLLRSCLTDPRINPNELLSGDRNALLIALRITGYGPDYAVEIICPDCNHKEHAEFDLQELPIRFLELYRLFY